MRHIGEVKGDRMVVRHKGVVVADLPAKSLTDEAQSTISHQ